MHFPVNEAGMTQYWKYYIDSNQNPSTFAKSYLKIDGKLLLRNVCSLDKTVFKEDKFPYKIGDMCLYMFSMMYENHKRPCYSFNTLEEIELNLYVTLPAVITSIDTQNNVNKIKLMHLPEFEYLWKSYDEQCHNLNKIFNQEDRTQLTIWDNWFGGAKDSIATISHVNRIIDLQQIEACNTTLLEESYKFFISYPHSLGINSSTFISDKNALKRFVKNYDPVEDMTQVEAAEYFKVFEATKLLDNTPFNRIGNVDVLKKFRLDK